MNSFKSKIIIFILLSNILYSQIKIYEINNGESYKKYILENNSTQRRYLSLNGEWNLKLASDKEKKIKINVPFYYENESEIILEKKIVFYTKDFAGKIISLILFDLRGSAEIAINENIIYKHSYGNFPIEVNIGEDIINFDKENKIAIKISNQINNSLYFPNRRNFLSPRNYGGILGGAYLVAKSPIFISNFSINKSLDFSKKNASLKIKTEWYGVKSKFLDDEFYNRSLTANFYFYDKLGNQLSFYSEKNLSFEIDASKSLEFESQIILSDFGKLTKSKKIYAKEELFLGERLIDDYIIEINLNEIKANDLGLFIDGEKVKLQIATYIPDVSYSSYFNSYDYYLNEFEKAKRAGFNAIQFKFFAPDPLALIACDIIGLLPIGEVPLNFLPPSIFGQKEFKIKVNNYIDNLLELSKYNEGFKIISLGDGYIFAEEEHLRFIEDLASSIQSKNNKEIILYANFIDENFMDLKYLNFIGIECFNLNIEDIERKFANAKEHMPIDKIIIGPITYSLFLGSTSGYLNQNSLESQAKLLYDLLTSKKLLKNGFIINSLYDYKGERQSLSVGYDENKVYKIGIIPYNRKENERLVFKVLEWKLNKGDRVTIPIGNKKDQTPMFFIYAGIVIGVLMGIFLGVDKKLKNDCLRSLNRSYNFFVDVRDRRIMTNFRLFFLSFLVTSISSLLILNILYFYRNNNLLDKLALAFGRFELFDFIFYAAWNPEKSFWILIIIQFFLILLVSILIYIISLIKNARTEFDSIYFGLNWALVPIMMFLPLAMALFKMLAIVKYNYIIFGVLALLVLWLLQRALKAIYIMLYETPIKVYAGFLILLLFALILILFYLNYTEELFEFVKIAIMTSTF